MRHGRERLDEVGLADTGRTGKQQGFRLPLSRQVSMHSGERLNDVYHLPEVRKLLDQFVREGKLKLTKILIAHRPETIVSAERVLVMANGRVEREYRPAERALRLVPDADTDGGESSAQRGELLA